MSDKLNKLDGIKKAAEYIETRGSYVKTAINTQSAVWSGENNDLPPIVLTCSLTEEQNAWLPWYNTNETHFDSEKMFITGLRESISAVNGNFGAVPSMRANMGCGIVPSLFGIQQTLFDDGKMPWMLEHIKKETFDRDSVFTPDDSRNGEEFKAAMRHMEYMTEKLREYDVKNVFVYPLDLQGAIDTAHLIYGDEIFYDFYDDPDFIHNLLKLSCDAMDFAMRECFKRMDRSDEFVTHYNMWVMPRKLGGLKLSEDTTTLLPPAIIEEFAAPYLRIMLERYNGGYVHYCGKNNYLLDMVLKEPLVRGINFGNPDMHDMPEVIRRCKENKKVYAGGLHIKPGENLSDLLTRVLEAAYDRETGCFYVLLQHYCDIKERENFLGEFERVFDKIRKN